MSYYHCIKCGGSFSPDHRWCPRCDQVTVEHTMELRRFNEHMDKRSSPASKDAPQTGLPDFPTLEQMREFVLLPADNETHIHNLERNYILLRSALDQKASECEGLRKDAERYRFLREKNGKQPHAFIVTKYRNGWDKPLLDPDELDAAIDAARGEGEKF